MSTAAAITCRQSSTPYTGMAQQATIYLWTLFYGQKEGWNYSELTASKSPGSPIPANSPAGRYLDFVLAVYSAAWGHAVLANGQFQTRLENLSQHIICSRERATCSNKQGEVTFKPSNIVAASRGVPRYR